MFIIKFSIKQNKIDNDNILLTTFVRYSYKKKMIRLNNNKLYIYKIEITKNWKIFFKMELNLILLH